MNIAKINKILLKNIFIMKLYKITKNTFLNLQADNHS